MHEHFSKKFCTLCISEEPASSLIPEPIFDLTLSREVVTQKPKSKLEILFPF